ncbi:major capsid protein [Paenibacillus phocaensis]|uniref:major capsid protein n=1 Tax=Paenibacillus phocaensis TaxID=1776378 RepID=UPI000839BACD|nr:major capsid protein [Paenibacillus phocaensis]
MKIKASAIRSFFNGPTASQVAGGDISIYQPQTMFPAYNKRMPVTTFLLDTFFPGFSTFETKHVLMDFKKNRQRVAPFVIEGSNPINIKKDGYRTQMYEAPYINLSDLYDVSMLQSRLPGEAVFGGQSPDQRTLYHMQEGYNEMDDMIIRREELMVAELIQTGQVVIKGYVDDSATQIRTDTLDYDFDNVINCTGTDQWNTSTSKKYENLLEAVTRVRQAGYNPTRAILGSRAWENLRSDKDFMSKYMDIRYAYFGEINPQLNIENGNGYMYVGRLTELGLDLFVYMAWYYDDTTQSLKPYINEDTVIVGTPGLGEMLYGANTIIPEGSIDFTTVRGRRCTKVTVNRETDTKKLIMKSRPVPKPFDVSAWSVINTMAGN